MSKPSANPNQECCSIYFEDECPRLGSGMRLVWPKVGWKWVRLTDALGRKARIKREVWDRMSRRGQS
jgi:hypothetical protein